MPSKIPLIKPTKDQIQDDIGNLKRTVPSRETDWIPYSIGTRNEVTVNLHSNKAAPKQ